MNPTIQLIIQYKYLLLFPLALFEGPILALVIGFLIYAGYLSVLPALLVMTAGDFFPDVFYFYVGRLGKNTKFVQKFIYGNNFMSKNLLIIEKLWVDHGFKMTFFSKLAYGLSTPLLISSGLSKMKISKFISFALPVTIFQYGVIMFLGYHLGSSYQLVAGDIKLVGLIMSAILIIFITIYVSVQKYARRQIEKLEREEETQ